MTILICENGRPGCEGCEHCEPHTKEDLLCCDDCRLDGECVFWGIQVRCIEVEE